MRNGIRICKPTSITYSGTSASIVGQGSVEFTGIDEVSLNGVFSSDYDNYMIVVQSSLDGSGVQPKAVFMDFPPYTSTTFTTQNLFAASTSVTASRSTSQVGFVVARIDDNGLVSGGTTYLYGPNLAQPTAQRLVDVSVEANVGIYDRAGTESSNTQHQNLRIFASGFADMSGRLAVYGLVD